MKRTAATHLLLLVLIIGAVLSLPGALLAAVGAAPGCSHCRGAGPGLTSGCCCCGPDMPGHCGASGPAAGAACRCPSFSGPALTSPAFTGAPTWQAAAYVLARVTVSSKILSPDIFHPPESQV